ncbi:MAG: DUF4160 domain-containing protein [Longimicrobiales bacterium]
MYGEHEAVVSIHTLGVVSGDLPPRALGLVVEWATRHQIDLLWVRFDDGDDPAEFACVTLDAENGAPIWPGGLDSEAHRAIPRSRTSHQGCSSWGVRVA